MKKLVLKLSLLPVLLFSVVSCRDDYHYYYTQEIDRQNTRDDGNFSFGNGFVSSDGEVLLKWLNKETTELDMENHPTLKNIKIIERHSFLSRRNLTKIILPEQLEQIKSYALSNTSLDSIIIPDSVKNR